jgi:hypothetical protein
MSPAFIRVAGTAAVLSFALAACGSDDAPFAPPVADATVYVIHGINGLDIEQEEALPVDVRVGTRCLMTNVVFGTVSQALDVAPGTYNVEIRLADAGTACAGTLAASLSGVQLGSNDNVSLVAHLDDLGNATVTRFDNDLSTAQGSRIVARHLAAYDAVDVLVDGEPTFEDLASGGEQVAVVEAGIYDLAIVPVGEDEPIFETQVPLQNGMVYIAYAVGSPDAGTFDVLLQQLPMR